MEFWSKRRSGIIIIYLFLLAFIVNISGQQPAMVNLITFVNNVYELALVYVGLPAHDAVLIFFAYLTGIFKSSVSNIFQNTVFVLNKYARCKKIEFFTSSFFNECWNKSSSLSSSWKWHLQILLKTHREPLALCLSTSMYISFQATYNARLSFSDWLAETRWCCYSFTILNFSCRMIEAKFINYFKHTDVGRCYTNDDTIS